MWRYKMPKSANFGVKGGPLQGVAHYGGGRLNNINFGDIDL
jgi:hypothetical protein